MAEEATDFVYITSGELHCSSVQWAGDYTWQADALWLDLTFPASHKFQRSWTPVLWTSLSPNSKKDLRKGRRQESCQIVGGRGGGGLLRDFREKHLSPFVLFFFLTKNFSAQWDKIEYLFPETFPLLSHFPLQFYSPGDLLGSWKSNPGTNYRPALTPQPGANTVIFPMLNEVSESSSRYGTLSSKNKGGHAPA